MRQNKNRQIKFDREFFGRVYNTLCLILNIMEGYYHKKRNQPEFQNLSIIVIIIPSLLPLLKKFERQDEDSYIYIPDYLLYFIICFLEDVVKYINGDMDIIVQELIHSDREDKKMYLLQLEQLSLSGNEINTIILEMKKKLL